MHHLKILSLMFLIHNHWADGSAIPAWVKSTCCGVADAHMDPNVWEDDKGNWHVEGLETTKPNNEILPSQDGHVWVFYNESVRPKAVIYCFLCR